jgi:hypothetical protein
MNVTCTGCPAKYAVPDEKVRGKKVRITCKHCGTNIVVDGSAIGADQSLAPKVTGPARPQAVPVESSYIVGFADDRQETHTVSEIVAMYGSAKIDEETLVWKDGMPDWLSPFDVPEIAAAFRKHGIARRTASLPLSSPPDDEPTRVARSPLDDNVDLATGPKLELELDFPLDPVKPAVALRQSAPEIKPAATPLAAAPKPAGAAKPAAAASRRTEKRGGAVDLFGGVADAGSEADASLDLGLPQEAEHKLTGARNESSVLFSLDALTKPDPKALGQKKARDKEQEKQATAALFGDNAPDSLSNMGGGGFSALAAPDFTKPVAAMPEAQVRPSDPVEVPNAPEKKRGAAVWLFAVLGIAAAAGVAFFVMQKKSGLEKAPESTAPDTKAAAAQPNAAEIAAAAPEAPAASATEAPATSPVESVAQAITAAGAKPAATAAASPAPPTAAATVNKPAEKPAETKKPDAPAAAPAAAADGAAFDKGAAVSALSAAAASAASCKKPDGPTGSGKVSVTFAPSGRATMTNVGGDFAGTEVGGCVARLFRAAKVPAFSGDPVTVSKSFSIE